MFDGTTSILSVIASGGKKRWHLVSAVENFRIFAKSPRKPCRHFHVSYRFNWHGNTLHRRIDFTVFQSFWFYHVSGEFDLPLESGLLARARIFVRFGVSFPA
jgi:hypothetical protein